MPAWGNRCHKPAQDDAVGRVQCSNHRHGYFKLEKLLALNDVARCLGRSAETLKKDMRRNPCAVPPRVIVPGARLLRWRVSDVEAWLAAHVEPKLVGVKS